MIHVVVFCYLQEFLDRRKMTEFGSLALVDEGAGDGDSVNISLPGVRRGTTLTSTLRPAVIKYKNTLFDMKTELLITVRVDRYSMLLYLRRTRLFLPDRSDLFARNADGGHIFNRMVT